MSSRKVVRTPLEARPRSGRTLDQRIAVRFPRLGAAGTRLLSTLPRGSRLRRAALARAVALGLEAYNRRDLAAVASAWHPEFEYHPGREWVAAGLVEPCYRGLQGYRRYIAGVDEVWGGQNHLTPLEVVDAGDRVVILADGQMRAQGSGVPLREAFALVCTLENGAVVRLQEYYDQAEALAAVGVT